MKPLFSIITVTYNAVDTLERTIRSVISQREHIEYIIIDGGSTDGTQEIVDVYKSYISYFVSEKDSGIYDAMNKGLKAATGEYVWFLNAGDTIHFDTFSNDISERISQMPSLPDIIYGETAIVDNTGRFIQMRRLHAPDKLKLSSFKMGMLVCHQSFIVKRDITQPYDLKYRFSSDYDWCIKCIRKAKNIYNSGIVVSDYLSEGMTTANRKASLKERCEIMKKNYGALQVIFLHGWFAFRFFIAKISGLKS